MNFSADLIASHVGGVVEGDGTTTVNTFSKIEEAQPGAITFLANPKYTHFIYTTKASIVLVRKDFVAEQPISATLIRVEDPYQTLSQLLTIVSEALNTHPTGIEQPSFVSPEATVGDNCYVGAFAYVAKGAKLGNNVKVYPQAYIGDGVTIGDNTIIYSGVKIYRGCKVGQRCILHSGAVIGADGFGFAPKPDGSYDKIPQIGIVEIADDVEIGANTTVDRATMGATRVQKGVKLDNLIQVAHNVEVGSNTVIAAQAGIAGSAKIGEQCMIGGQAGIAGHITIGGRSGIAGQSGIEHSIPEGSRMMGSPAIKLGDYARQTVHIKRLADLFDRVSKLEKEITKK
jgi:UDP-3-O-[3-hydroxymyristoyl] glucosamine N-acyltransferase